MDIPKVAFQRILLVYRVAPGSMKQKIDCSNRVPDCVGYCQTGLGDLGTWVRRAFADCLPGVTNRIYQVSPGRDYYCLGFPNRGLDRGTVA